MAEWEEDVKLVRAILNGDDEAWNTFVERYADRVLATAVKWCHAYCWRTCPFDGHSQKQGLLSVFLQPDQDCDEASEAFLFILQTVRKKCLPSYQGRCSLSTFLFPLFHPVHERRQASSESAETGSGSSRPKYGYEQLLSDFLRSKHGRIRPPQVIRELGDFQAKVFVQICYGRDDDAIAAHLRLSTQQAASLPAVRDQIEETLREHGWCSYWEALGARALGEPETFTDHEWSHREEVGALEERLPGGDDIEQSEMAGLAADLLATALRQLEARECVVLRLAYGEGQNAKQIGTACGMKSKEVYTLKYGAIQHLREAIRALGEEPTNDNKEFAEALEALFHLEGKSRESPLRGSA